MSWHPLAHRSQSWVKMMMCLASTFLVLLCYVNNFKRIKLGCFLLLCVWHSAYVNWWDIKWVCLCRYKYTGCKWKQPNNQGLFWLSCQSMAWKILQKLIMTWSWQWHENHFWISDCFFEHRRQEQVSVAPFFPLCRLNKSRKHSGSFSNAKRPILFLIVCEIWENKATEIATFWENFGFGY